MMFHELITLAQQPRADVTYLTVGSVVGRFMPVFFVAFMVTFIATPLLRMLALRYNIIDQPDLKRKAHMEPVAYLGGVGLFLGWLAGIACLYALQAMNEGFVFDFRAGIILGALVIVLTGLYDDIYGLTPRLKIAGQLFAAAALASGGVATDLVHDSFKLVSVGITLDPNIAYVVATIFIAALVIGGCNAMNLLDGLDGLATGVAIIAVAGFLFIATYVTIELSAVPATPAEITEEARLMRDTAITNMSPIIIMSLALMGALLGFLPYNFNPANIFMGDAGSLLLGFLCVSNILLFADVPAAEGGTASRGPLFVMAALIVFGVPICDTALAIFRRKLRGQPILSPDNQHMHHLLVKAGFGVKRAVLIMYALGALFATLGAVMAVLNSGRFVLAIFMVVFGFIMVTAYKFGHQQVLRDRRLKARTAGDAPLASAAQIDQPLPPSAIPSAAAQTATKEPATETTA